MRTFLQKAAAKYTYSRKKGQKNSARSDNGGGSGWSEEGKQYFDFLYRAVQTDRNQQAGRGGSRKDGISFNKKLLNFFLLRRFAEESTLPSGMEKPMKKKKVLTHHTCDNFTDSEGENKNINDNSYGGGTSLITNMIAM
jgi:hypothetical protein